MQFNDRLDSYVNVRKSDGMGGYIVKPRFKEKLVCAVVETNTKLLNNKYSLDLSKGLCLCLLSPLDLDTLFKYDDEFYNINTMIKANNKYMYILDITKVVDKDEEI